MVDALTRLEKQKRILAARVAGTTQTALTHPAPQPPFHLHDMDMLYFLCRFDPKVVRACVPAELSPAKSSWGLVAGYLAPQGWEIAPFSAFYVCFEIEGHDGPDGFPCMYQHTAYYGGHAYEPFRRVYNANTRDGWSVFESGEGKVSIAGGIGDTPLIRMQGTPKSDEFVPKTGVNFYAAPRSGGGINLFSVPFSCPFVELEGAVVSHTDEGIAAGLPQPLEVVWAIWSHRTSVTLGIPEDIDAEPSRVEKALLAAEAVELFGRLGRAAIVVDDDGNVPRVNKAAYALLKEGRLPIHADRFRPGAEGSAILSAYRAAARSEASEAVSERFALSTSDGQTLIGQCLALEPGRIVVFFDDPSRPAPEGAAESLRLLGLTEAEARVAAAVGAGKSPREAAVELELSQHTVRSTLKSIFGKLDIGRQSELAKIVTRLEAFSVAP